jgi:hypothetical protein
MKAQRLAIGLTVLSFTILAAGLSAAPPAKDKATKEEERAIAAIKKLGGSIERDSKLPGNPVVEVDLSGKQTTDADLAHLKAFPELRKLDLKGNFDRESERNHLTDAGLKHLRDLHKLEHLNVAGHPDITDASIEHLEKLSNLKAIDLVDTSVTEKGVKRLKRALPKAAIRK